MPSSFYNPGNDVLFPAPGRTAPIIVEAIQTAQTLGREITINFDMGSPNPRRVVKVSPGSTFMQVLDAMDSIELALSKEHNELERQATLGRTRQWHNVTAKPHSGPIRELGDAHGDGYLANVKEPIEATLLEGLGLATERGRITLYFDIRPQAPMSVTITRGQTFGDVVNAYYRAELTHLSAWMRMHHDRAIADYQAATQQR
jgi:hypothetical protein